MKKVLSIAFVVMVLLCVLTACGPKSPKDTVSKELGLDVSAGKIVSDYDTHSGNGDGTSCIVLSFEDDSVLKEIRANQDWKSFPLDETIQTLVYGVSDETGRMGPFLEDEDGNNLVPEIRNGYYLLIDRHTDKKTDILHRYSFNFTVGLYDTDSNRLYCCDLDT